MGNRFLTILPGVKPLSKVTFATYYDNFICFITRTFNDRKVFFIVDENLLSQILQLLEYLFTKLCTSHWLLLSSSVYMNMLENRTLIVSYTVTVKQQVRFKESKKIGYFW